MAKALRDYLKFGCAFVQILMNADGSKIVGINAKYCRLSFADPVTGTINQCVVSGKWPDVPAENEYQVYDVLDEYDPYTDLQRRRWGNKTAGKSFIYVIRDSWGNGEYYSSPRNHVLNHGQSQCAWCRNARRYLCREPGR
jgi:hypothetical protein